MGRLDFFSICNREIFDKKEVKNYLMVKNAKLKDGLVQWVGIRKFPPKNMFPFLFVTLEKSLTDMIYREASKRKEFLL